MKTVLLSQIKPNPRNPRQIFDPSEMESLEKSIKSKGIYLPLVVMEDEKGKYILLDGERRYKVANKIGLKEVPVEVRPKMSEQEQVLAMFHIQEQHKSWNHFDKARAIHYFSQTENMSNKQMAETLGISEPTLYAWMNILALSKNTQGLAIKYRIPFSYLRYISHIAQKFTKICDLPVGKIEEILVEKINNRVITRNHQLSLLSRVLSFEGNENKKMKFLEEKNVTVEHLADITPAGTSLAVNHAVTFGVKLNNELKGLLSKKDTDFSPEQIKVLEKLSDTIQKFI